MKKDPPIEVAKNGVGLGLEGTGVAPGEGCVVPSVEDLARWLADEDWMPKPVAGGSDRKIPALSDSAMAEMVWLGMPEGLRVWCLEHEKEMWKGGQVLPHLEEVIRSCNMPVECATRRSRHADMTMCACHMSVEWATRRSRHADMHMSSDEQCEENMHEGRERPTHGYWGHKCLAWRNMVVDKLVACGMQRGACDFVLSDSLGFGPQFGKMVYEWDGKRDRMRWMLSVADKFVTLMCRADRPTCLTWDPICRVTEPTDWKAGGVHDPHAIETWESLHDVSAWVVHWVKHGFWRMPYEMVAVVVDCRYV